tara:strand:+ start:3066 stop:3785 length:720 start_codon:yes stop_codon:yes gene_type:complete
MNIEKKILISAVIPITDETFSLKKTIEILLKENNYFIKEIIIVASKKLTTKNSLNIARRLALSSKKKIKILFQKKPYFGGAMIDGFSNIKGTHLLMIASDLETHPREVKRMIKKLKKNPDTIIGTSRWLKDGGFSGYNSLKLVLNFLFQNFFKILFLSNLTDFTYGFRIFPKKIIKKYKWKEFKHPLCLEMILRPIKDGYKSNEIAVKWKNRSEGVSKNPFFSNFNYFLVGIKIRFNLY